ncbi:MAG: 1-deoxy-D-xylulose-5-phosphate reductoisomerase [Marinovum algicola]|uniref:1-deoxy-D-xylulose-5-phosphate reductoisomerase n=1 Tax=Marinovum algicola TaxID=42444 RepID=UPI0032EAAF20
MAVTISQREPGRRRISILGSTGSVGCSTIDLIRRGNGAYEIEALTAHSNVAKLVEQATEFRPALAVIGDETLYEPLKAGLAGTGIEVAAGPVAIVEAASRPADWIMAAIVGAAGLEPTLAAVRQGAIVGLANKESLVCAGDLVTAEIAKSGATLLPVDSEHSAIFQVFDFDRLDGIEKIILTASGGPFRTMDLKDMEAVTPEQAVAHPNWSMGAKISVDSATMMNKGLEVIEAHHLFPVDMDRIEIIVHPQSIVHSMVSYVDGSVLAHLGSPDMRTPIAYALSWPARMAAPVKPLDLAEIGELTFQKPEPARFPALRLAREALAMGGSAPTVLNAANEVAVAGFLAGASGFLDICRIVERTMEIMGGAPLRSLDDVRAVDQEARRLAHELMNARRQRG